LTDRTGDSKDNYPDSYATHLWLQVLPKDYVLKDSNGNCYLAFIMNKKNMGIWNFHDDWLLHNLQELRLNRLLK
jgi:hypothetical protein